MNNNFLKIVILVAIVVYSTYFILNLYSLIFSNKELGYGNTGLSFGVVGILCYLKIIHDKIR